MIRFRIVRPGMGLLVVLALTLTGLAQEPTAAQRKLAATDEKTADADYALQGEYVGWLLTGANEFQPIGLQVVALGNGRFQAVEYEGGLPGAGAIGKARMEITGQREQGILKFEKDHLRIAVANDRAVFFLESYDGVIAQLQKVTRVSRTLGAKPPKRAIVIFDGSTTEHFEKGTMTTDKLLAEGAELKRSYSSYLLHLEFRLPYMPYARGQGRANSGVYLQSRYEVQILDSFGLKGKNNECGGLYKYREPAVNLCLPPLAWQTYDIDFTAAVYDDDGKKTRPARLTVKHNGVLIHDDINVERKTGSGKAESPVTFPIKLQNHGNPIRFRNIWLLDRSPALKQAPPAPGTTTASTR